MKYRVDFVTNSSSSSSVVLMFMNKNEIVSSISYEIGIPTESLKEYKSSYSRVLQYIILTKQLSIFTKNEDLLRDYVEVSGIDVVQIYKSYEDLKGIKSAQKTVELLDQINALELMSASLAVNTFSEFESHEIWNFLGINPISVDSLKEEYRLSTDDDEYYDKTKLNIKRIGNEENKKRKLPVTTKSNLVLSGSEDQMILEVSKKPKLFNELPEEMRESEFVKKTIINLNPMSIIYMTNVSEDLYLEALSKEISVFEKLNEELKINEEFLLKAIKANEDVYDFIKNTIKTKKKFVLNAVSINGKVLGLLDIKFRQNANIVLAALRNNVNSCEYIGSELLEDSKFRKEFDIIAFEQGIKLRKPKVIYDYKVGDVKPRNNGRKWEEEDLKYLIDNYKKGIELDTIAFELGRGTLGCILKLESNNADTITNLDKLVAKFSKDVIAYVDSNHLTKTTAKPLIEKSEKVIVEKQKTTNPKAIEADIKKEVKKHKESSSNVEPIQKENINKKMTAISPTTKATKTTKTNKSLEKTTEVNDTLTITSRKGKTKLNSQKFTQNELKLIEYINSFDDYISSDHKLINKIYRNKDKVEKLISLVDDEKPDSIVTDAANALFESRLIDDGDCSSISNYLHKGYSSFLNLYNNDLISIQDSTMLDIVKTDILASFDFVCSNLTIFNKLGNEDEKIIEKLNLLANSKVEFSENDLQDIIKNINFKREYLYPYRKQEDTLIKKGVSSLYFDFEPYMSEFDKLFEMIEEKTIYKGLPRLYKGPVLGSSTKSGCYIATSLYGSYDHPEVMVLRKYRDLELKKSYLGRLFIQIYYRVSPFLVKQFGGSKIFKVVFGYIIKSIINNLKRNGF